VTLFLLAFLACDPAALARASASAEALDLHGALAALRTAGNCDEAAGTIEYVEGLLGATEAFEKGGTIESLRDVRSAANALSRRAEGGARKWEAASLALRAVIAGSQQERGEMGIYLAEATRIEALLLAGGLAGAPLVTAHELAGDLWLQVHQFADARAAYERAATMLGYTPRILLGLGRAAEHLDDKAAACAAYRSLAEWWDARSVERMPAEITRARERAASLGCPSVR